LARLFFAELDDLTRSVVESMNEEDNLLILSDHGFKIYKGTFYLNDWLHQRGYLQTSLTSNSLDKTITTARHVLDVGYLAPYFNKTKTSARIWKMMVGNLDDFCRRKLDLAISYSVHRKFDLEHSLAYCREESEGGIRLSPRITSNHSARNTLVKKIIKELSYLVGLKAIRREDLDEGPYLGSLADIYIDSEQYFVQGGIHGSILDPTPIAQHHVDGILILHGKCFTKNLTDASITDITPTILYLLGLPIPSDMSGRVLEEAIKDGPSMVYTTPTQSQISGSHTNEDKDKILSRLKALGYV
jgi:predicted AlkP superfamily phosphohydrolase/phosphomutase